MFTPIVDLEQEMWDLPASITSVCNEYKAKGWNQDLQNNGAE
jgi:hypothetical protein